MKKWMIAISLFLVLLGSILAAFQTGLAKKIIQTYAADALAKGGFQIKVEKIEGSLPHALHLQGVVLYSDSINLSVDILDIRLSWLSLLQRKILINNLYAKGISWKSSVEENNQPSPSLSPSIPTIPIGVEIKKFRIDQVKIPEYASVQWTGSLSIGKKNRRFDLDIEAVQPDISKAKLRVFLHRGKTGFIRLRGSLKTPTLSALPISVPLDTSADFRFYARGPQSGTLHGKASGTLGMNTSFDIPQFLIAPPGEWNANFRFQINPDQSWAVSRFVLSKESSSIRGQIRGYQKKSFEEAKLQIVSNTYSTQVDIRSKEDRSYQITLDGSQWRGTTDLSLESDGKILLPHLDLQLRSMQIKGNLVGEKSIWTGNIDLAIGNLGDFPIPSYSIENLYGSLRANIDLSALEGIQSARIEGKGTNLYWQNAFCETASFILNITNPWENPKGSISLNTGICKWKQLVLESIQLTTNNTGSNWEYLASIEGRWKHPLSLQISGSWNYQPPHLEWILNQAAGSFYNHPISLKEPVTFHYSPDEFNLSPMELSLEEAKIFCTIKQDPQKTDLTLSLSKFPLDVLSLNPLDVSIKGAADGTLQLTQKGSDVSGSFHSEIQQMQVASLGEPIPLLASGGFNGKFQNLRLNVEGSLYIGAEPLLEMDLSLPTYLNINPPAAQLIYDQKVKGHLAFNGRIEEILDFFNLGMHRIAGDCSINCDLYNTLQHPAAEGNFLLKNGSYENYITGMEWVDLTLSAKTRGDKVRIELSALDKNRQGNISAVGSLRLHPQDYFPFQFDVRFKNLEALQIDLVSATTQGNFTLVGNTQKAIAQGEIEVIQSTIHIPSHVPRSLPNLQVVYKNASKPPSNMNLSHTTPYPLFLDLEVKAPQNIFIEGRGVTSEWKGNFHLGGTYTSVTTKGKLELIQGNLLFSGRTFQLIDGSLTFRGQERETPIIDLAALMQIKDIAITTRLKGPLNQPQITLQSVPPLPMSTIMAYLLFGQDMGEINSFQALQLANSLASFAGEGPDIMEKTRKSLGVDRLQVVSVPTGDEEIPEAIAVQVGKYVSEGILVSFTQGAEDASTNISIEVEMKRGFFLQLESDQRQEQGKFTLKWTRSF